MGFNFRKSIKIAPGVKLNLGKKSAGISIGGNAGGVSFNTKSGARARVSAPGTGLSYTTKVGGSKAKKPKTKLKAENLQVFQQYLKIFDDSVKLLMTTKNPETFFGRYDDALRAAYMMADITDEPIVHDEPPQAAVEALKLQKTDVVNAFLERYAKDITLKAYELTRNRERKLETFYLVTSEYENRMSEESIAYRDGLYTEMKSKLAELTQ